MLLGCSSGDAKKAVGMGISGLLLNPRVDILILVLFAYRLYLKPGDLME